MQGLHFCANLKWLFTELPFEQRFAAAAQAGFEAVEFGLPYDYEADFLLQQLKENGLRQILINTPIGPADSVMRSGSACQPQSSEFFRNGMREALRYAAALDCPFIHLQAGILPPGVNEREALQQFISNIKWSLELAVEQGVCLLLEPINLRDIPGFFLHDFHLAANIIEQFNSPHLRLMFDIYHCQISHGDISHNLLRYLPLTGHIQVADAPYRSEPGSGELNWDFIFKLLRQQDYQGWIGCEYKPLTNTAESLSGGWSGLGSGK
ncbi:hydroxypyruvate isomerase family protein [Rouxiella sp. WC2420]|uniref:Hydroxypyruvate isomerase family protein n=1 Tax=Rouxiella sp. WC2420 TaxID=3234145 RepID=A0AB39VL74_9GAMM